MCVIKSKKLILHDVLLFKFVMNKCLTLQRNLTYNNIKQMTYLYNEETRLKNEKKEILLIPIKPEINFDLNYKE